MSIDLTRFVDPSWVPALKPHEQTIEALSDFVRTQIAPGGPGVLPAPPQVFRALRMPLQNVRVLIVGQDPYPTPGHAVGLSFSVGRQIRPIPRSLENIYTELHNDLGVPVPPHGDLSEWTGQGVLLLNRVLTVSPGAPASHQNIGWESVTAAAITALAERGGPLVAILWGSAARSLAPLLHQHGVPTVESPHPSPLSAHRGFFGSKPFSRTNTMLMQQGAAPIDWEISA